MKYGVGALLLVLGLTGCGQAGHSGSDSSVSGSGVSAAGLEVFKTTVYSYVNTQGCVKCHGAVVSPKFAASDANEAYLAAKSVVNFSSPDSSDLATYAGNSHCGDQACSNPANTTAIKALIAQWVSAENASNNDPGGGSNNPPVPAAPKYMTGSMALPATIPTIMVTNPAVIRIPLNGLNVPVASLNNALLEVEVQMSNATQYRFRRPKIIGNSAAVNVKGIHLYIRSATDSGIGVEDSYQLAIWNAVNVTAAIFARPATLPATPLAATPLTTSSVFLPKMGAGDVITIGFDDLQ